jgi:Haem-binding uptake, Tiki superfamily, ChaN
MLTLALLLVALLGAPQQDKYTPVVEQILSAWNSADLVCLGEDHGSRNDSDLRLALIRHPRFAATVGAIVVEMANPVHQAILDRFVLDGAEMSRDELSVVWRDANGAEVWEAPIYEEFLRAVRAINLPLAKARRVRVIGGDTFLDWQKVTTPDAMAVLLKAGLQNRGASIRKLIAEQILDRKIKALAIYGAGHCVKTGMGFPGELEDKYPGRIWSAYAVDDDALERAKQPFNVGDRPSYVVVSGTKLAALPADGLFFFGKGAALRDMLDAVIVHGSHDVKVAADLAEYRRTFGAELARRQRVYAGALKLIGR